MQRTLRSNVRFERAVGTLFEKFEGRETELRTSLKRVLVGLQTGDIKLARQHHPSDFTACVPLIEDFVMVIRPLDNFTIFSRMSVFRILLVDIDMANTETIDPVTVEQEPA